MQRKLYFMLLPLAATFLVGCGNNRPAAPAAEGGNAVQASSTRTGVQLWADNCNRCHNYRPGPSFSDTQWEAVVMHMRLRADLTGEEQRKITEFMKASH